MTEYKITVSGYPISLGYLAEKSGADPLKIVTELSSIVKEYDQDLTGVKLDWYKNKAMFAALKAADENSIIITSVEVEKV